MEDIVITLPLEVSADGAARYPLHGAADRGAIHPIPIVSPRIKSAHVRWRRSVRIVMGPEGALSWFEGRNF